MVYYNNTKIHIRITSFFDIKKIKIHISITTFLLLIGLTPFFN